MKLDEDNACPFLAHDRLCSIQKEHGEGHLSLTCSQYPRSFKTIDGVREQTLLLSCPEAARLVLQDRKLIPHWKKSQREARYRDVIGLDAGMVPQASMPMAWFRPIRNFAVFLIQDRTYPLWQRVFLLHMFCKRLQELTARSRWEEAPALLAEYGGMIAGGSLHAALDSIPAQTEAQLAVLMIPIEERAAASNRSRRFAECIDDFARGIGYQTGSTPADLAQNYMEANGRYFQPWAAKHGFMLENYLLNYVFSCLFPFGKPGPEQGLHPLRESLLLCFQFGLIKGLLIGMAGCFQSEFSRYHVVKLIQSFSKAVQHNAGLMGRIENFFAINGLNDTNGIAALLRDPVQVVKTAAQMPV